MFVFPTVKPLGKVGISLLTENATENECYQIVSWPSEIMIYISNFFFSARSGFQESVVKILMGVDSIQVDYRI